MKKQPVRAVFLWAIYAGSLPAAFFTILADRSLLGVYNDRNREHCGSCRQSMMKPREYILPYLSGLAPAKDTGVPIKKRPQLLFAIWGDDPSSPSAVQARLAADGLKCSGWSLSVLTGEGKQRSTAGAGPGCTIVVVTGSAAVVAVAAGTAAGMITGLTAGVGSESLSTATERFTTSVNGFSSVVF